MDGLTNIITKISQQNDEQCASVIASAKEKAQAVIDNAKKEADEFVAKQKSYLEEKNASEKSKAESSAEFEYKRVLLEKKCALIDECMKKALDEMCNAPCEQYFANVKALAVKYALKGEGTVLFNKKDLDRLPDGFESLLNGALEEGKTLKISNDSSDIDSGFVINYPEMRVDCTFSSLMEENADSIKDAVNRILFS